MKTIMKQNIDLNEVIMYQAQIYDQDFFGWYQKGYRHKFICYNFSSKWEIIPKGCPFWSTLDELTGLGINLAKKIVNTDEIPDWLPDIPLFEEVEKVPEYSASRNEIQFEDLNDFDL